MATGTRGDDAQGTPAERGHGRSARRSRVSWPDVRRAVREAHECKLVHAVKVRRDGAIDLVIKWERDDVLPAKSKKAQPSPMAAPQQEAKSRKQRRMDRKNAFHMRKREEAAAALGIRPAGRPPGLPLPALLPPPPPAPPIPPLPASLGAGSVTMGERVDKREAAQVGADKTPTKQAEENAAEAGSHGKKTPRGTLIFSNATGRSLSRR